MYKNIYFIYIYFIYIISILHVHIHASRVCAIINICKYIKIDDCEYVTVCVS